MSLEAFLAEGDRHEQVQDSGGEFPTIAKVQIRWAYRSGFATTSKYFTYPAGDEQGRVIAETQCIAEIGDEKWTSGRNKGKLKEPVHGLLTEVYGDDVPTSKGGFWKIDKWKDFIPAYEKDKTFANMAKKLPDEIKNSVTGAMPYTAIVDTLMQINAPMRLFNEPTWCKLIQEIDQWEQLRVARGLRDPRTYEGNEAPYQFWLVTQVYENETEAKAEAETINGGQGLTANQSQDTEYQISNKAFETWGQGGALSKKEILSVMKTRKTNIENFINNALNDGLGMSLSDAQKIAANGNGMETSDLPLIGIEELKKSPVKAQAHIPKDVIHPDEIPF